MSGPPFVLIHGGQHGGWCWRRVTPILRAAGHEVFVLTLTGLGERSHLLRRDTDLGVHVQDLVALAFYEDISGAVFVAHSYGGMVLSGAVEKIAPRVRSLVFLDAHMPMSGESRLDICGPEKAAWLTAMANAQGEGWFIPALDASHHGVSDPNDAAWVNARLGAQPLAAHRQAVGVTDSIWTLPGTFIECRPNGAASVMESVILDRARRRSAVDPRFRYRVLDAHHDAMITAPDALCELLLEAANLT